MAETELKIVCSGKDEGSKHDKAPLGRLSYRGEDTVYTPEPHHFADGDPRREDEPIVLHAGTTVRGLLREERPGGGTKVRARCTLCPLDLPLSWDTVNRGAVLPRLLEAGVPEIELYRLIQLTARIRTTPPAR